MDPFSIGMALFSIGSTFASMGAARDNYNLAKYNSDINVQNTITSYNQGILQAGNSQDAALSNVSTIDFQMQQYRKQQEQYKTDLNVQETGILSTQSATQAATGIGGAGSSRAAASDIKNKVKEYSDIIDARLIVTNEFDPETGIRIVNSEMDQLLLDQDTQQQNADAFAESILNYEEAIKDLEDKVEEGSETSTFGEEIWDAVVASGEAVYEVGEAVYEVGEQFVDWITFWN